jgi:hypothetical protein
MFEPSIMNFDTIINHRLPKNFKLSENKEFKYLTIIVLNDFFKPQQN